MWDYFAWSFAARSLRYNFRQSFLTVGIVATSVTLIIFLTALISGLQKRLVSNVTDAIAHVIIRPAERVPIPAWKLPSNPERGVLYVGETIKLEQSFILHRSSFSIAVRCHFSGFILSQFTMSSLPLAPSS